MNIAFFASYNGSSAHAITDACFNGDLIASPVFLLSNNKKSNALKWAEDKGLKTACLNGITHPDPDDLDKAIADKLELYQINIICLSGYMKLLGPHTMKAVNGKVINVHPALLPKYDGKGMYGDHVHQAVKDNEDTETGSTIHLVNEKYDEGRILAQNHIALSPQDSVSDIAEKVKDAEPTFYVDTLRKIIKGDILLD